MICCRAVRYLPCGGTPSEARPPVQCTAAVMRGWRPALAWLALCCSCARVVASLQWTRVPGQPLADTAARWGALNANLTMELPAATILDLRNATFKRPSAGEVAGGRPFSRGVLTLQGAGALAVDSSGSVTLSSVIDTANRVGLVPMLDGATVTVADVALINICLTEVHFLGRTSITPFLIGLFSVSPVTFSLNLERLTLYVPRRSMSGGLYLDTARTCPAWPSFQAPWMQRASGLSAKPAAGPEPRVTAHEYTNTISTAMMDGTFTYRSLDAPDDPLLQFVKAEGTLAPPRLCNNGSLVPPDWLASPIDTSFPLWMSDTPRDTVVALVNATTLAKAYLAANLPVPGVMIFNAHTPLPEAAIPGGGTLQLDAPLLLCASAFNAMLPRGARPVVDLSNRTRPLWSASEAGQLLVINLAIQVPALPSQSSSSTSDSFVSALPLTALAAASNTSSGNTTTNATRTGAMIELYNVSLVLPVVDYLALLTLATDSSSSNVLSIRACMDDDTLRQAALLSPGIQTLLPGNITAWDTLPLAAYTGWGVNTSQIIIQPQIALPASITQRCALTQKTVASNSSSNGSSDASSSSPPVGIIVGCTVGGTALVVALAAMVVLLLRRMGTGKSSAHHLHDEDRLSNRPSNAPGVSVYLSAPSLSDQKQQAACGAPDSRASADTASTPGRHSQRAPVAGQQPASRLLALLDSHEQELLGSDGARGTPRQVHSGGQSLNQVHEQLLSVVAASQAQLRSKASVWSRLSFTSQASCPQEAVRQLATQLQGQGGGADALTLERVIGQGGGGTVYRGTWRGLPVAVKTMVFEACEGDAPTSGPAASASQLPYMRAIMETAISASLGHLHVVATYHFDIKRMDDLTGEMMTTQDSIQPLDILRTAPAASGMHTYKAFLVQELCGCSLRSAMQAGGLNSEGMHTSLSLLHQVACGLEYLHGQGIIHGDLTPGNILLKADGQGKNVVAKLADFGLSQRMDAQATHVSNFGAGTPFYVAPEVVSARRTSPASDMFSFGVVAWEVLSLCQPYVTAPGGAWSRNPLFPQFPPGRQPPHEVDAIIRACLASRPQARPSAAEVLAVLSKALKI